MTLRVTVLPASSQAGKETIRALLEDERKPIVHAVYRDVSKAPSEFTDHPNFKASKGDVSDGSALDFSESDAVFYVPPPTYDGEDTAQFARRTADNFKAALQRAPRVKRLLLFSAMGAQHEKDIGILCLNHISDEILKDSVPEVVIARTGFFMENFSSTYETINADPPYFESYFTPLEHKVTMVSTFDIGNICAQKLMETGQALPSKPHIFDLHGPRNYSSIDVKDALEKVTGKRIKIVAIKPEGLVGYFGKMLPTQYAQELADMTKAILPGGLVAADMEKEEGVVRGSTELSEVLRKFVTGEAVRAQSGAF